jgi:hypothetical protein
MSVEHTLLQQVVEQNRQILERLDRLEQAQSLSVVKEGYTTQEAAERLKRAEFTVRQWCNKGQVRARKVRGRGRKGEWRIAHDELIRVQADGPSPERTFDNRGQFSRRAS